MKYSFEYEKESIAYKLTMCSVSKEQAEIMADCLATADLYGVTSHGSRVLSAHIDRIKRGGYNLDPNFKIISETAAFAIIDGDNALGPVSAHFCMEYAVQKCKDVGIFHVFSRNNNTFGPAFYYPLKAAEQGMIGLICSNSPAQMAPFGGNEKMLGTNPFSAVIPVPGKDPIIIDMATSVVAKSKFKEYKDKGLKLPEGWALNSNGYPTDDPDEAMRGLVLPMAGFKGYGIAMLIDILSGVISGAAYLNNIGRFYSEDNSGMNVGFCCITIDPQKIVGDRYAAIINEYVNSIRNSKKCSEQEICLPGDDRIAYRNSKLGVH